MTGHSIDELVGAFDRITAILERTTIHPDELAAVREAIKRYGVPMRAILTNSASRQQTGERKGTGPATAVNYESIRSIAREWREKRDLTQRDTGVVLVFDGKVYGWKDTLRDPQDERPFALAVRPDGRIFVARGGNDYDRAKNWILASPAPGSEVRRRG